MSCLFTYPDILQNAERSTPAFLEHLKDCRACASLFFPLAMDMKTMGMIADSPLSAHTAGQFHAAIHPQKNGFRVDNAGGFSVLAPVPVRGHRGKSILLNGPVILESSGANTFRIIISSVKRECVLVRDSSVIFRSGEKDRFSVDDLGLGEYRLTVDDTTFSFSVV